MANAGLITTLLVIFTTINLIAVFFAALLGVPTIGQYVVYNMFDENNFDAETITGLKSEFDSGFDKTLTEESTLGGIFVVFDGLKKVFSWFITILTLGFAIFFQLQIMGAPFALSAIIGLPIALSFYAGIISAVRGFSI
jgi:hypothetical protein